MSETPDDIRAKLRRDDGTIDARALGEGGPNINNLRPPDAPGRLDADTCCDLRERLCASDDPQAVYDLYEWHDTTLKSHASGRCTHTDVGHPALRYVAGDRHEWVIEE